MKPTDLPAFGLQRDGQEDEKDEEDAEEANDTDADADDEEPAKQRGDRESDNEEDETMEDGPIGDGPDPAASKLSPKAPKHTGATDDDAEGGDAEDGEEKDDPSGEDAAEQLATAEPVEEPVEEVTDEQEEAEADVEAAGQYYLASTNLLRASLTTRYRCPSTTDPIIPLLACAAPNRGTCPRSLAPGAQVCSIERSALRGEDGRGSGGGADDPRWCVTEPPEYLCPYET